MEIFAPGSWNFELVQLFLSTWIVDCLLPEARMVCTVNNLFQGSWNFEFSTFLYQSDKFVRHAWLELSVFSFDGKFLLAAVF